MIRVYGKVARGNVKNLFRSQSLFRLAIFAIFGFSAARAQVQDTSGNAMLNGTFEFRHVAVLNIDSNDNPVEIAATYGTITFDGNGNYRVRGTIVDNTVLSGEPEALVETGTYAIGSNGAGYVANPLYPTDPFCNIYGGVAQGVFAGSTTEVGDEEGLLNDIFVAIPTGSITGSSFNSGYQAGLLDFAGGGSSAIKNALFELIPNGSGSFGTITLNGQASNQIAATVTQTISGATYSLNGDGSATLSVPLPSKTTSTTALFTGSKTMFQSADGNFILGWTSGGYDIFFGVKAITTVATNAMTEGLYFNAAIEDSTEVSGVDSYYGSINNSGDSSGDGILHARLSYPLQYALDYGTDDQISVNSNGTTGIDLNGYQYSFGDSALAYVGIGTYGDYALLVGLHAPSFSGSGVFINPVGIFNAASLQPITASLAPGELILLTGSGLANTSQSMAGGQAFPTTLANVQVTVNQIPCAIYFVSPTEIAAIVPYELASNQTGLANIQVINGSATSNVVQMYFDDSAPGAFSQGQDGIGYAAATHAATGQPVTSSNPAQGGETIVFYLTGLGTVSPAIQDGAVGPSSPLSYSDLFDAGNLAVYFFDFTTGGSAQGNVAYAGLVPTLAGLYQINVQVPSTGGLGPGDNLYIGFETDMAYVVQIQIPYGSPGVVRRSRPPTPIGTALHIASRRTEMRRKLKPALRGVSR